MTTIVLYDVSDKYVLIAVFHSNPCLCWCTVIWATNRLGDRRFGNILGDTIFTLSVLLSLLATGDDTGLWKSHGVDWSSLCN